MLAEIGYFVLVVAFSIALFGIGAAVYGTRRKNDYWVESARRAMIISFPLTSVALICLVVLLLINDFQVVYVYGVSSSAMPIYLKLAAVWGGQEGSLLFWAWMMSGCAFLVARRDWQSEEKELLPWIAVILLFTLVFFIGLVIFYENPFLRYWLHEGAFHTISMFRPAGFQPLVPTDGNGMNPLLRHPGMIFHPPALYIGFIAFIVPYSFVVASLITGNINDNWIHATRKWTFVAWLFLSLGLILGARWAYDVLGWGGYWGWDPVEISALMPWLTGTAFIHSVMIQERRGLFRRWNTILILLTYILVIFGTFITRSGVLSSVHSFAQSAIGPLFFAFIAIIFFVTTGLIIYRWNDLRSTGYISSIFSREGLFLINNFLFISILIVCFWGVIFPMVSEVLVGQRAVVGPPFYEKATGPLFAALILLMGIAPLSIWGYSSLKRLGKNTWVILVITVGSLLAFYTSGIRQWPPLLGFGVCIFTGLVTVVEYIKGILIRRQHSGENILKAGWQQTVRNRSRYGGYLIHLGVVLIAIAVIGIEMFQSETQATLSVGESFSIDEYTLTYQNTSNFDTDDGRNIAMAYLEVTDRRGKTFFLYPRRDYYYNSQQAVTIPGVRSNLKDDIYSVLVDWDPFVTQQATFKVYRNPLVIWLWIGGIVFILGTMLAVSKPDGKKGTLELA